jgi:hypothetical protein
MVFFNYATMQMAAKIVYYGPGLCGKTTNLHYIYAKTSPQSRGEMVSLETETDRTLFFDLLPIDVGVIGGFKTRLQLYTIPGQVFYNTTRKLVLKGVDGIVFVADSQLAMLDANVESLKNLRENLAEIGLDLDEIPLVLQLNKRDLPNLASVDQILAAIDPQRRYEHVEAAAVSGMGVFETLKTISKLTLRTLRRRMTGEEPVKPAAPRRDTGSFRVKGDDHAPPRPITGTTPAIGSLASPSFTTPVAAASVATAPPIIDPIEIIEDVPAADEIFADPTLAKTADVDAHILSDAPVADYAPPLPTLPEPEPEPEPIPETAPFDELVEPEPAPEPLPMPEPILAAEAEPVLTPEPDVDFSQTEKPVKAAEVKHVKVRSSVDIMAELEALRKRATTQTTPKPKKEAAPMPEIIVPRPKRDVRKSLTMSIAPGILPQARSVRVAVSFEGPGGVLQTQEQAIELGDTSDVQSVAIDVKLEEA